MENQRRSCADRQQLAKLIGRVVLGRGSVGGGSGNQMTTDTPRDTSWPHSHVSSTPWEFHACLSSLLAKIIARGAYFTKSFFWENVNLFDIHFFFERWTILAFFGTFPPIQPDCVDDRQINQ